VSDEELSDIEILSTSLATGCRHEDSGDDEDPCPQPFSPSAHQPPRTTKPSPHSPQPTSTPAPKISGGAEGDGGEALEEDPKPPSPQPLELWPAAPQSSAPQPLESSAPHSSAPQSLGFSTRQPPDFFLPYFPYLAPQTLGFLAPHQVGAQQDPRTRDLHRQPFSLSAPRSSGFPASAIFAPEAGGFGGVERDDEVEGCRGLMDEQRRRIDAGRLRAQPQNLQMLHFSNPQGPSGRGDSGNPWNNS